MSGYNTAVQPDRVLDLILQSMNELVNYELAVILKLHNRNQLVVEKAAGPLVNDDLRRFSIDLMKRRDIADLIQNAEPFLFNEETVHTDTYEEILNLPDSHSCLVAPLYLKDEPIGLLTLDHRACGMFSPAIVRFIGTLAKLIAIIMAQNDSSTYLLTRQKSLTQERNLLLRPESGGFEKILGDSPAWRIVTELIRTVSASDLPVLIQGETGTGKEETARTVHDLSDRKDNPFITLNCSALTTSLAESELFGHEKGAFTSAVTQRKGRFELADGGTLFLDEIADLPLEIQPKLLRTLQEGTFERVGGEKTLRCDVRLIAASNKDLREEVRAGRFREDLYYRLGVFPIHLPPLREREDDVILLAGHFMARLRGEKRYADHYLTPEAVECLLRHPWPGNVRELQNVIQRSALVAREGRIGPEHLGLKGQESLALFPRSSELSREGGAVGDRASGKAAVKGLNRAAFPTLDETVKNHIERALAASGGRIYGETGAARLLGLKPTTLQSRMKKLGISP